MFKRHSYIAVIHNICTRFLSGAITKPKEKAYYIYAMCTLSIVHTHIIKKGEVYQKPKTLIVWIGET